MADSYRDVDPFPVEKLGCVLPGQDPAGIQGKYARYAITPSGVSPRLLPGVSEHLVVADSHEHTETGHITEDLTLRPKMVEKRLRKAQGLAREVVPPSFLGPEDPELILVGWGSTKGAMQEAANLLAREGRKTGVLHFSQVWPLVEEQFLDRLTVAKKAVCVEGNATGQLARLIRRETGFEFSSRVSRYDGLPMTPGYILDKLDG